MANQTEKRLLTLIEPLIDDNDLLLWDLSYGKVGGQYVAQILVDKPNHELIRMDEITALTETINLVIDEAVENGNDPVTQSSYLLDIASPGASRLLNQKWQFEWALAGDELIDVALYQPVDNVKIFQGKLGAVTDDGLELITENATMTIAYDAIAKASLAIVFE